MVIGTTLAPDFETDSDLIELAKKNGDAIEFTDGAKTVLTLHLEEA